MSQTSFSRPFSESTLFSGRPPHSRAPPGRASTRKSWSTNLLGQQMGSWDKKKKKTQSTTLLEYPYPRARRPQWSIHVVDPSTPVENLFASDPNRLDHLELHYARTKTLVEP